MIVHSNQPPNLNVIIFGVVNTFKYKNHIGRVSIRVVIPFHLKYGSTEFHTEEQWLLEGYDMERKDFRTYALKDIIPNE